MIATKPSFSDIFWYAKRARGAYETADLIQSEFPDTVRIKNLEQIDVQYFLEIMPEKKLQVISVRGTANLANAKEDADYIESNNPKLGIYVHRGFESDSMLVYQDVKPHLVPEFQVRVTGHSLGAAISTLLMIHLYEDGYSVDQSINFGQPKITNREGVAKYRFLPLLRVADENDVVPMVPPVTFLDSIHGRYEHFGAEIILLSGEFYVFLKEHKAERKSVAQFWRNIGHESVKEHFMVNYLKNINSKMSKAIEVPYDSREQYIEAG